jgi:hypothetical protein
VLTVVLPKSAEARAHAKRIPIKAGPVQIEQGARGREESRQRGASEGAAAH